MIAVFQSSAVFDLSASAVISLTYYNMPTSIFFFLFTVKLLSFIISFLMVFYLPELQALKPPRKSPLLLAAMPTRPISL